MRFDLILLGKIIWCLFEFSYSTVKRPTVKPAVKSRATQPTIQKSKNFPDFYLSLFVFVAKETEHSGYLITDFKLYSFRLKTRIFGGLCPSKSLITGRYQRNRNIATMLIAKWTSPMN